MVIRVNPGTIRTSDKYIASTGRTQDRTRPRHAETSKVLATQEPSTQGQPSRFPDYGFNSFGEFLLVKSDLNGACYHAPSSIKSTAICANVGASVP